MNGNGMKSRKLSVTEVQRPDETDRALEDILGGCLVRSTNLLALLRTLADAEAFQGPPADCLEGLTELMARLNEDISEAHEAYEVRVQSSGGTR